MYDGIEIVERLCGGGTTVYGITKFNDGYSSVWDDIKDNNRSCLSIDEDDSYEYLEWIFKKYYDKNINNNDGFDHWGDNIFTVEDTKKIIAEIKEIRERVRTQHSDAKIDFTRCGCTTIYYRDQVLEFYDKFIEIVTRMLDENTECKYFAVLGP